MDPPVVDEDVVHLEVRAFGIFAVPELDKRILQRVLRFLVLDDLATEDLSKPRKDQLEVLARRHGVQLAHEQDVLGRCDVGKGQVADHLEREGLRARVSLAPLPGEFFGIAVLFELFFVADAEGCELLCGRYGRLFRCVEPVRIIKGVVEYDNVADPNIPERSPLLVRQRLVDLGEGLLTFDDAAKGGMFPVEVVEVVGEGEEELAPAPALVSFSGDGHAQGAIGRVAEFRSRDGIGDKVRRRLVRGRGGWELVKDGRSALAGVGRVTGLGDKVLDDVVERAKVVLVGLAEFDKVEREDRAQFGFEVDDDVSDRGLEEDRHSL